MRHALRLSPGRLVLGPAVLSFLLGGCVLTTYERPGEAPRVAVPPPPVSEAPPIDESTLQPVMPGPDGAEGGGETISASHLVVMYAGSKGAPPRITRSKPEARARAQEALVRARAGEDFAKLAAEYSDEPGAAQRGGALGSFTRKDMVKPFSDAAFELKAGEVSEVIETPFGFHVIKRSE